MTFYAGRKRYEGEWSGGLRSGWGRMYYPDGSIYEGQWLENKPNGQGMLRLRKYPSPSPDVPACPLQAVWCCAAFQTPLLSGFLDATSHLPHSLAAGLRLLPCVIPPLLIWCWRKHRLGKGRCCAAQAHTQDSLFLLRFTFK